MHFCRRLTKPLLRFLMVPGDPTEFTQGSMQPSQQCSSRSLISSETCHCLLPCNAAQGGFRNPVMHGGHMQYPGVRGMQALTQIQECSSNPKRCFSHTWSLRPFVCSKALQKSQYTYLGSITCVKTSRALSQLHQVADSSAACLCCQCQAGLFADATPAMQVGVAVPPAVKSALNCKSRC